jgi:hypothetical protein
MEKRIKTFNLVSFFILGALQFTACSPSPTPSPTAAETPTLTPAQTSNPFSPQPGDSDMLRGDVQIHSASLNFDLHAQQQVNLYFTYYKPTACDQLRVEVSPPDAKNQINLSVYSLAIKDKPCNLLSLRDPLQASLSFGSYSKGHYSVYVNGFKAGEFDA